MRRSVFVPLLCGAAFAVLVRPSCARADDAAPAPPDTIVVEGARASLEQSGVVLRVPVDPLEAADLPDLLERLPGVQVRAAGGLGSYSEASLRGSNGRQVRLLLDGLPLDTGGGEATSLSLISPLLLEQVDVYKGRVPVGLGSGLAGTIDLRTRRALPEPVVGTAAVGSLGELQAGAGAQLAESLQLFGGYQTADNDFRYRNAFKPFDPDDPDRQDKEKRHNAGTDQGYGLLRWRGPMVLTLHVMDDEQELPTAFNNADTNTQLDTRSAGVSAVSPEGSEWQTSFAYRYTREHFRDPDAQLGIGGPQDTRQETRDTNLGVGRDFGPVFDRLGIEHQEYRTKDRADDSSGPSARRLTVRNGAETHWGDAWRFNGSLDGAWSRDESGDDTDGEWQIEPAVGVAHAIGVCVAAANLGYRKRLPTFFERYGDRGLFRGNPALDPERATYGDVGARCAMQGLVRHAELTLFGQDLRDAISPTYTAQGIGRSINTGKAEIHGVELGTGGGGTAWTWEISGTWQHTEDRSQQRATRGRQLPGRFENQLDARLERTMYGLTVFYEFHFESGAYYDSAELLPADAMRRHDVGVRGAIRRLGWSLQWLNVGGEHFEQFNGFPIPGQRVRFSITWPETKGAAADTDLRSES